MKKFIPLYILILLAFSSMAQENRTFNLEGSWDLERVLNNPHKGIYHHYYDNSPNMYKGKKEDITAIEGLDHLMIRLAWSFFEPHEGKYDWSYIDDLVNTYASLGYKFSFVFTSKESNMKYATPTWVKDAGANGEVVINWGQEVWEPDYDDPIFLQKLDNFHRAVAERYQEDPWLSYVQVASYGTWGEGHNYPASNRVSPNEVIKKHIDIYLNHYTNPMLKICISDDVYGKSQNKTDIKDYVETNGLFWTDHSGLVAHYVETYPETYSIATPILFQDTWKSRPVQLELQHYHKIKEDGNWSVPNGEEIGAQTVINAVKLMHATWFGFHGDAKIWYEENPDFAKMIANLVGYRYKITAAVIPQKIAAGSSQVFQIRVENIGVAPAYHPYEAIFKIYNKDTDVKVRLDDANNMNWLPENVHIENYPIPLPQELPDGIYEVGFKLFDNYDTQRDVDLALHQKIKDSEGFFKLGTLIIKN